MKKSKYVFLWNHKPQKAILLARPNRFQIEVLLNGMKRSSAHCVNPGRGEGLMRKGARIWLASSKTRDRSLPWTWVMTKKHGTFIGTDSLAANELIFQLIKARQIFGFRTFKKVIRESTFNKNCRFDFEVKLSQTRSHYIEVKNCHLKYPDQIAYFPDSRTCRSIKHLRMLRKAVKDGHRASIWIAIQRSDVSLVRPSEVHDPEFCKELRLAVRSGVEVRGFLFKPSMKGFSFEGEIPVDLNPYSAESIERWSKSNKKHSGWNHWNSSKDISS